MTSGSPRDHRAQRAPGRGSRGLPTRGFTLLEVLIALAVLGVALGALIKAASDHTRNTHYLQERTLAHWAGQNVLARYEAGLLPARTGSTRGNLRQGGLDWEYRVDIREESPDAPFELPPVLRLDVTVWPASGTAADARARVSGYVLP